MARSITLAIDIDADPARVFDAVSTTAGQRAFWTGDCDVSTDRARFGFPQAPMDLETDVAAEANKIVRMHVTSGFPFWDGSTWEWELGPALRSESGTSVIFRHYGFGEGYGETDLGYTAQTWAMILDRLSKYVVTGTPQPFFPTG